MSKLNEKDAARDNNVAEEKKEYSNKNKRVRGNNRRNRRDDMKSYKGKKGNDYGWHAKVKTLAEAATSIPWSYSTGRGMNRPHVGDSSDLVDAKMTVPGIFTIKTVLTPGVAQNAHDAINVAARALYTDVRSKLKSANSYDAADLMIYMLALAEIKACIAFTTRILGTPLNFTYENAFFPDDLIRSQGINPEPIHSNYLDYRSRANQIIAKASQIWWPKGFDFVTRAEWEYGNYYTEGSSIKDQIYMFVPGLFRKFQYDAERDYQGMLIPILKFNDGIGSLMDLNEVLDALDEMIDAVITDTDFQNIAGDLFNCYGAGGVETFTLIPENLIINPVFSFEVLEQIQNSRCLFAVHDLFTSFVPNTYGSGEIFQVRQDVANNLLIVPNKVSVANANTALKKESVLTDCYAPILTVDKDPNDEKTMLITRCTNCIVEASGTPGTEGSTITVEAAMEFVVSYCFYWRQEDTGALQTLTKTSVTSVNTTTAAIISPFHYHPLMEILRGGDTYAGPYPILVGAIDTYSHLSAAQLRDINRVDLMSLFAVPDVGKVNG